MIMISGKKALTDDDKILKKMRTLEQLLLASFSTSSGVELDIFPWLKYFGHPLYKKLQVLVVLYFI